MTKLSRELALASAVVAAIMAGCALGYFVGLPPPSQADVRKCAVEIEKRRVVFGPEKCAAYVKPISVQVRSWGERFGNFLLSSFTIKVDTTVRIKKEIGRGKPWYPGIECIFPHRSSHPDDHVFAVGEVVVVIQRLLLTNMWFWRSKQWRCDSDTG